MPFKMVDELGREDDRQTMPVLASNAAGSEQTSTGTMLGLCDSATLGTNRLADETTTAPTVRLLPEVIVDGTSTESGQEVPIFTIVGRERGQGHPLDGAEGTEVQAQGAKESKETICHSLVALQEMSLMFS